MNFAMSYSFGKDSALALWRLMQLGHTPVCLITTVNQELDRSWFHGIGAELRGAVSRSMDIPLLECRCGGEDYIARFEETLMEAAEKYGAEACAFGDIDIEDHQAWNRDRCAAAKLHCLVPLWHLGRDEVVGEIIGCGIKAVVKCTQNQYRDLLGRQLDAGLVREFHQRGSDICGENGEYHTFVWDGPMFRWPVGIAPGQKLALDTHSLIDLKLGDTPLDLDIKISG